MPFWILGAGLFGGSILGFQIGQELPEEPRGIQDNFFDSIDIRTWFLGSVAVYIYVNKDKKRTKTTHTKGWRTTATDLYSAKKW